MTCGKPLLKTVDTLIESGEFRSLSYYQHPFNIDKDQLYQEWNAQIQKIYHGIIPTHLDSHHHTHTLDENQEVVVTLAKNMICRFGATLNEKMKFVMSIILSLCFDVVGETDENDKSIRVWKNIWQVYSMILREDKTIEVMSRSVFGSGIVKWFKFWYPRTHQVEF